MARRASNVASNAVRQGSSNRIVCSLEIFPDRERPAGETAERVHRVFVLISSKQEMRLSIGERFVSSLLLVVISYGRLIQPCWFGRTNPPSSPSRNEDFDSFNRRNNGRLQVLEKYRSGTEVDFGPDAIYRSIADYQDRVGHREDQNRS